MVPTKEGKQRSGSGWDKGHLTHEPRRWGATPFSQPAEAEVDEAKPQTRSIKQDVIRFVGGRVRHEASRGDQKWG